MKTSASESILEYKNYLFSISYNITGCVELSEDLVQDTFEKWFSANRDEVINPQAYLSKIVVNKSIDALEKLKKERMSYKGVWLPEPLLSHSFSQEENSHTLDFALLFLLEKLNPYERAVFVLREVFSIEYQEIAEFIGSSYENCRQIFHRAKEKVKTPIKKKKTDPTKQKELLTAFLTAAYNNDIEGLKSLFKEDIVLYSDGGGKAAAALKPLSGIAKVVKFIIGVRGLLREDAEYTLKEIFVNNTPAILITENGNFHSIVCLETSDEKIFELYTLRNPDKIKVNSN